MPTARSRRWCAPASPPDFPDDGIIGEEDAPKPGSSGFHLGDRPDRRHHALPVGPAALVRCHSPRRGRPPRWPPPPSPGARHLFDARRGAGFRRDGKLRKGSPDTLELTGAMTAIGASHRTPALGGRRDSPAADGGGRCLLPQRLGRADARPKSPAEGSRAISSRT